MADALQYRPGITGSNFAPGANRPVIRGLDNFRVRVQENGIGSHDVSALSEDHAVPIDPFSADQIEVVRGPGDAALRLAGDRRRGERHQRSHPQVIPPRGFSIETRGGLNSVDRGADGAFKVTAGSGNFAVHADAFKRHAGDYDTPHGRMANSFVDSEGFSVGGSLIGRPGSSASPSRAQQPLRHPRLPRIAAHRHASRTSSSRAASGAWRHRHRGHPLSGSAHPTTRHNEVVPGEPLETGSHLHQQGERKGASRCSICRSRPRSASCAAPSARSSGIARRSATASRATPARPGAHEHRRRILVRGAAGDASACACRPRPASSTRRWMGPGLVLTSPNTGNEIAGGARPSSPSAPAPASFTSCPWAWSRG